MSERIAGAGGAQVEDLLQNLSLLGLDPEALCRPAGLDRATLLLPTTRVPWHALHAIFATAEEQRRDPLLALHAGALGSRDLLSYLVLTQPTVDLAIQELARFLAMSLDDVESAWERRGDGATLAFAAWPDAAGAARQIAEYLAAVIVVDLARASSGRFRPSAMSFTHARRGDLAEYERVLRCRVRFGQPRFEMVVASSMLATPLDTQSPEVAAVLREAAERHPGFAATASIARRVAAELRTAVARSDDTSPAAIARRLATSQRTLQRRLEDAGTSFRALRDEARRERAVRRLADPAITIAIVADELGFNDVGAFHKAFRRWTGTSPNAYRQSALSDA